MARSRTAAGGRRLGDPRRGRATRRLMGEARNALSRSVAVVGAFAGSVERFPCDAGGIVDPRLFRLGIAARGLTLFDDGAAGVVQPGVDLFEFVAALGLDTEMIEAGLPA